MGVCTKIDLKTAYHQILIDDNFKEVTTINTPVGLLKWRRMPYGIKTASAIFQRAIEQVLGEDIKKYGLLPRRYIHRNYYWKWIKNKTDIVLNRLRNTGMTINKWKMRQ